MLLPQLNQGDFNAYFNEETLQHRDIILVSMSLEKRSFGCPEYGNKTYNTVRAYILKCELIQMAKIEVLNDCLLVI